MRAWLTRLIVALLIVGAPRAAFACPVCFGQNDSPLAWAVNMGVFVMLGFVAVVLSAFAAFFIYLARRARRYELLESTTPQEGTAQC
jgi:hypothetical protein